MSSSQQSSQRKSPLRIWLEAGTAWLVLCAMFGANVWLAYTFLGPYNVAVHSGIGVVMALVLLFFLMDFREYNSLLHLAALSGVFWLLIMFVLAATDYLTRY